MTKEEKEETYKKGYDMGYTDALLYVLKMIEERKR